MPRLTLLEFDATQSSGLYEGTFVRLTGLEKLQLFHTVSSSSGESFRFLVRGGLFATLATLNQLILSDLGIESLPVDAFYGLEKLKILELNHNRLSRISPGTFARCQKLSVLVLSRNMIHDLGMMSWSGLSGLKMLDLNSNKISKLRKSDFEGLGDVSEIDLARNQLKSIADRTFAGLGNLQMLYLSNNELSFSSDERDAVPGNGRSAQQDKMFRGLHALEVLEINNNDISSVSNSSFEGLLNLRRLELSHNRIETIREAAFDSLLNLHELTLQGNRIKSLREDFRRTFDRLTTIDLSSNPYQCDCDLDWLVTRLKMHTAAINRTTMQDSSAKRQPDVIKNLAETKCSSPIAGLLVTDALGNNSDELLCNTNTVVTTLKSETEVVTLEHVFPTSTLESGNGEHYYTPYVTTSKTSLTAAVTTQMKQDNRKDNNWNARSTKTSSAEAVNGRLPRNASIKIHQQFKTTFSVTALIVFYWIHNL